MQAIWEKFVQPACLAVAAIFGIVSSWQGMQAKQSAERAEQSASQAKQALDRAASQREDLKIDRDYQVQITTMALDSLKQGNAQAQRAMVGLVGTLPNAELAQKLTLALTTSEDPAVRKEAAENLDASKAFEAQQRVDISAAAQKNPDAVPAAVGGTRQLTSKSNAKGWDLDIFWCDGSDDRKRRAEALGTALARLANSGTRLDGETLGRIRVRPLPALINQRPQYQIFTDIIGPDAGEAAENRFAAAIAGEAAKAGAPLAIRPGTKRSAWYVSAFYCAGV